MMHVRIISNSTVDSGSDPTIEETTRLAQVMIKAC
jgi:hypothetical protein